MREGATLVEGQRRQHREHRVDVIAVHGRFFPPVQVHVIHQFNAMPREARQQLFLKAIVDRLHDLVESLTHGGQLHRYRLAVDTQILRARRQFLLQRGHTNHEELVQIAGHDREEFHSLQQLVARVARFLKHAPLKLQQTQFPVHVERMIVQRDLGLGRCEWVRRRKRSRRHHRFGVRRFRRFRSRHSCLFSGHFCLFHGLFCRAGNVSVKVVPLPSRLSTLIVPSIRSTTCRTMESPSPVPPTSRDRARSTR